MEDKGVTAVNACEYLFLSEIEEMDYNGLRLVIREGRRAGGVATLASGRCDHFRRTRIDVAGESAAFELIWTRYVAYSVVNESFAAVDDDERYTGNRFRLYSKSHFIDYVSRASFATQEYPGPTQHFAIVCENHVVNVIAAITPVVQRLGLSTDCCR